MNLLAVFPPKVVVSGFVRTELLTHLLLYRLFEVPMQIPSLLRAHILYFSLFLKLALLFQISSKNIFLSFVAGDISVASCLHLYHFFGCIRIKPCEI